MRSKLSYMKFYGMRAGDVSKSLFSRPQFSQQIKSKVELLYCHTAHNSICMIFKESVINVSFKCGYLSFSYKICFLYWTCTVGDGQLNQPSPQKQQNG